MIPDSTNVRVMADNIRKLHQEVEATVGLKDYSITEVDTGQKWIDGKNVYCKAISGTLPEITQTGYVAVITLGDVNFLYGVFTVYNTPVLNSIPLLYSSSGNGAVTLTSSSSEKDFIAIAYYTKPDPEPGNREPDEEPNQEPETKKSTKRKTTKGEN